MMRLFERDAYEMLARIFDPAHPLVVADIGANVGDVAQRIVEVFPRATVHAFEPAPDVYEALCARVAHLPSVYPVQAAAGDENGTIDLHVCDNRLFTSALRPNDRGHSYYGAWVAEQTVVRAPMVRLDDWAAQAGIKTIDVLKVDVQGFELHALRGADRLLRESVKAVYSEAQLHPEYEGACTLTDIDLFLRERGFVLHQIHDVYVKGPEQQVSCCDGLWVRRDVLERFRMDAMRHVEEQWPRRVRFALSRLAERGVERVALYGAGSHTRALGDVLAHAPLRVECVVDDDESRHGGEIHGVPVVSQRDAIARGVKAVVISASSHEDGVYAMSAPFIEAGIPVYKLYVWGGNDLEP